MIYIFPVSPKKKTCCGIQQTCLTKVLLRSTHNIHFHGEIRNYLTSSDIDSMDSSFFHLEKNSSGKGFLKKIKCM